MKSVIKLGFFALVASSVSYFSTASAGQFDLRANPRAGCGCERHHSEHNRCRENRCDNNRGHCHENGCHENECHDCHHHHHHHQSSSSSS